MNDLVERAAKALQEIDFTVGNPNYTQVAKAIFKAIREPSRQMLDHAYMTVDHTIESIEGHPEPHDQIKAFWQAIVDEALE